MIGGMFQEGTDLALDDQMQRPKPQTPPTAPGFSFMNLVKAPAQGIGGAAAKTLAFGAEMTGAFGDVMGAYPEAVSYSLTDEQRKQGEAARRKLLTQGPSFSNDVGDTFRQRAKDILPDPNTTHASAQIVAGLFDFGAQAVGYSLTAGPMAPFLLGGDVAMAESDRLKQQGVDLATRLKAGGVAGVMAGASIAVPMSGATALTRGLKGVAVGEGTIVGQSLAEKAILKAGGYDKIADTFDPLDPVALALGVVPGALGAKFGHAPAKPTAAPRALTDMTLGERQALKYNDTQLDAYAVQAAKQQGIPPEVLLAVKNAGEKSGPTATSPAGAQGVMQFMPSTFRDFGRGDAMDPMNSIDAGAKYLKSLYDQYGNWDAAIAHYNGGGKSARAVLEGRALNPETTAYLGRTREYMGKVADDHVAAAIKAESDLVPAARALQAADALEGSALIRSGDLAARDAHVSAVEMAMDQMGRGDRVEVADVLLTPERASVDLGLNDQGRIVRTGERGGTNLADQEAYRAATASGDQAAALEAVGRIRSAEGRVVSAEDRMIVSLNSGDTRLADTAAAVDQLRAEVTRQPAATPLAAPEQSRAAPAIAAARQLHNDISASGKSVATALAEGKHAPEVHNLVLGLHEAKADAPRAQRLVSEFERAAREKPNAPLGDLAADAVETVRKEGATPEAHAQATIDRAAAEVSALNPDMLVQLDGMEHPVQVGDLIDAVKKEAADDVRDGRLVEAAAACALRG